jgi:hypothetical protein
MRHDIPPASLERLRAAYANFEVMANIVSEAMGLGPGITARIDLGEGAFFVEDGKLEQSAPERVDGLAEQVPDVTDYLIGPGVARSSA